MAQAPPLQGSRAASRGQYLAQLANSAPPLATQAMAVQSRPRGVTEASISPEAVVDAASVLPGLTPSPHSPAPLSPLVPVLLFSSSPQAAAPLQPSVRQPRGILKPAGSVEPASRAVAPAEAVTPAFFPLSATSLAALTAVHCSAGDALVGAAVALEALVAAVTNDESSTGTGTSLVLAAALAAAVAPAARAREEATRLARAADSLAPRTACPSASLAATQRKGITFAPPERLFAVRHF